MAEININELVALAGYTQPKANLMKVVIDCAVETLTYAEKELEKNWAEFCGKKGALLKPHKKFPIRPNENAITYELADYVDDYLKRLPMGHLYRGAIKFYNEKPKRSKKLAGSNRKRLDFRFEADFAGGPELVIEAKPLFFEKEIKEKYYGASGLGRFIRAVEPYSVDDLGGLLAYVRIDQTKMWQDKILLKAESAEGFQSIRHLNIGKPLFVSYTTAHKREVGIMPIWMLHIILRYPH